VELYLHFLSTPSWRCAQLKAQGQLFNKEFSADILALSGHICCSSFSVSLLHSRSEMFVSSCCYLCIHYVSSDQNNTTVVSDLIAPRPGIVQETSVVQPAAEFSGLVYNLSILGSGTSSLCCAQLLGRAWHVDNTDV
jgi:hypothetical protein